MGDTEMCLARSDGGLLCTRPAGHAGDHAAAGRDDQVIESWAKEPDAYRWDVFERSVKAIKADLDGIES